MLGAEAEVPPLPYRIHFVPVRDHTYSASSASHGRYEGPLVFHGVVHLSRDQAFVAVEPTAYIHLITREKTKCEQSSYFFGGRTH